MSRTVVVTVDVVCDNCLGQVPEEESVEYLLMAQRGKEVRVIDLCRECHDGYLDIFSKARRCKATKKKSPKQRAPGEMVYTCGEPGCGRRFPLKMNLTRHITASHGRLPHPGEDEKQVVAA